MIVEILSIAEKLESGKNVEELAKETTWPWRIGGSCCLLERNIMTVSLWENRLNTPEQTRNES